MIPAFAFTILALPLLITAHPLDSLSQITYINVSSPSYTPSLMPRGGDHYAHLCDDGNCGDSYKLVNNFGCGGTCYYGFQAQSVLLAQSTTGNPKPTGSMYTSDDCSGSYKSVGIYSGQLTGCTSKGGGSNWQSAYLYFNC